MPGDRRSGDFQLLHVHNCDRAAGSNSLFFSLPPLPKLAQGCLPHLQRRSFIHCAQGVAAQGVFHSLAQGVFAPFTKTLLFCKTQSKLLTPWELAKNVHQVPWKPYLTSVHVIDSDKWKLVKKKTTDYATQSTPLSWTG